MVLMQILHHINWFIADAFTYLTEHLDWHQAISQVADSIKHLFNDWSSNLDPFVDNFFSNIDHQLRDFTEKNFPQLSSYLSSFETLLNDIKIALLEKGEQILSNRDVIIDDLANKISQFIDSQLPIIQEMFSQWQINIQDALAAKLSEFQHSLNHFIAQNYHLLEPKLEQLKYLISEGEQLLRSAIENRG